mmetsp:Transcript_2103/g.6238  ORF Transcript_2103/g.6238 Transcript_2103/m.6238 type:complete len:80 (+) Transcript_2103:516-755(+)
MSLPESVGLAAAATGLEFPLDHAKHALFGGGLRLKPALLAAIRLPFATMLLLVFDRILDEPSAPTTVSSMYDNSENRLV